MPTLSFEGETHAEIVRKVQRWLHSVNGKEVHLDLPQAVERASELTKDALTVIAQAAPAPIARTELMKAMTRMGYEATDQTRRAIVNGLDTLNQATDDDVLKQIRQARNAVFYEMNAAAARQVLKLLR